MGIKLLEMLPFVLLAALLFLWIMMFLKGEPHREHVEAINDAIEEQNLCHDDAELVRKALKECDIDANIDVEEFLAAHYNKDHAALKRMKEKVNFNERPFRNSKSKKA
jgi:cobalamin biosynthesis protein CbiG